MTAAVVLQSRPGHQKKMTALVDVQLQEMAVAADVQLQEEVAAVADLMKSYYSYSYRYFSVRRCVVLLWVSLFLCNQTHTHMCLLSLSLSS